MKYSGRVARSCRSSVLLSRVASALVLSIASIGASQAQKPREVPSNSSVVALTISASDRAAVSAVREFHYHLLPARTEAAQGVPLDGPEPLALPAVPKAATPRAGVTRLAKPGFYPLDLTYFGGALITSAVLNNVYFNCADQSCWGNPIGFQNDLVKSKFIHLVDQYVGSKANNRYAVGTQFSASAPGFTSLTWGDILILVHAAATASGGGNGYGHIINIFLPQGTAACLDPNNTICYIPDNPLICAWHSHVVFSDIGETVFTVEPFQDVPGCAVAQPSPNGPLVDSTDDVLSHELFETIGDPDLNAWLLSPSTHAGQLLFQLGYDEIGDLCQGPFASGEEIVPTTILNHTPYALQLEYSNKYHACANAP